MEIIREEKDPDIVIGNLTSGDMYTTDEYEGIFLVCENHPEGALIHINLETSEQVVWTNGRMPVDLAECKLTVKS